MAKQPHRQERLDALWTEIGGAIDEEDWPDVERLLRRFSQLVDPLPAEIVDTLAYTLLMQGDFTGCLQALLPLREQPGCSFWLHHKLGDALRGLNRPEEAVRAFRRSLLDGSLSSVSIQ